VRLIVGMADMKMTSRKDDSIITYALGSCLGITVYDPVAGVGGMLHVMLPDSSIDPKRAEMNPFMFLDTGLPLLFHAAYQKGAKKERMIIKVAGGREGEHGFQIGKRNFTKLRQILWKNGVFLKAHDVGGDWSRTMILDLGTGAVTLRTNDATLSL
jgi:chemotaxis protein CheD